MSKQYGLSNEDLQALYGYTETLPAENVVIRPAFNYIQYGSEYVKLKDQYDLLHLDILGLLDYIKLLNARKDEILYPRELPLSYADQAAELWRIEQSLKYVDNDIKNKSLKMNRLNVKMSKIIFKT